MRPHRRQPTRLPHSWDSPGKNTGVGCHFLLHCVKSESEVAQSCLTLSDPMYCSPPGFSIHGIFQARVLGWGAIPFPNSSKTKTAGHPRPVIMWVWFSTLFSPLLFFFKLSQEILKCNQRSTASLVLQNKGSAHILNTQFPGRAQGSA